MANGAAGWLVPLAAQALLFLLLGGMAASVDTKVLRERFRSPAGILVGLSLQFLALPAVGYASAKAFDLDPVFGVSLLAVTSSPGGAYSNWWCSLFNADLALSIAMTTCSTMVSMVFTPLNLAIYTKAAYGVGANLDHLKLFSSIGVAVVAILSGLLVSHLRPGWRKGCNVFGNIAGVGLIIFSFLVSSSNDPIWDKDGTFYLAVAAPCVAGLVSAFCLGTLLPCISSPEAVAVTVETGYQNTGLALAIALATFDEEDRGKAAGVPLYYGFVQVVCLPIFLLVAWRAGLTYAPRRAWLSEVILKDYQPTLSPSVMPEPVAVRPAPPRPAFDEGTAAEEGSCIAAEDIVETPRRSSTTAVAPTRNPEDTPKRLSATSPAATTAVAATRTPEGSPSSRAIKSPEPSPRMRGPALAATPETRSSFRLGEEGACVDSKARSPSLPTVSLSEDEPRAQPPGEGAPRASPREDVESVASSLRWNSAGQAGCSAEQQLGSKGSEVAESTPPSTLPPQPEQGEASGSSPAQSGSGQAGHKEELQAEPQQAPSSSTYAPLPSPRLSDISRLQATPRPSSPLKERLPSDDVSEVGISRDFGMADVSELAVSKEPSILDLSPRISEKTDVLSEAGVAQPQPPRDPPVAAPAPPALRLRLPPRSDTADRNPNHSGAALSATAGKSPPRGAGRGKGAGQGLMHRMATLS